MKIIVLCLTLLTQTVFCQNWIRINQMGYSAGSLKRAVLVSKDSSLNITAFTIHHALTDAAVDSFSTIRKYGPYGPFASTFSLDFSALTIRGSFYIAAASVRSPIFRISDDPYRGASDFLLRYMRQQRSGYNPYLKDSCHTADGFIIYHPTLDSTHIDVSGGWHDASDYLQYTTTTATAVYQLLFAYQQHPAVFGDQHRTNGDPGANGIPDILDEAKWGLDWLVKMNPSAGMYFNQIADDRDHRGFRLPTEDTVNYGKGKERPVYFITGQPQGIYQHKNRATGAASTVAKFASSFALGASLLRMHYPEFAALLHRKAVDAYEYAAMHPGVAQTAPCRAPYFYEEDNWKDDMELAAAQLNALSPSPRYLNDAVVYGNAEPFTPWLGADTARHYQWYPFVNLGHYLIAGQSPDHRRMFTGHLREGIERVYQRAKTNAFHFGIPFIWCSNNLVSSFLTQVRLYRTLTNDHRYDEMETALRDWLFGCNPWGTSMVVGLPAHGDTPVDPHSAFTHVYGYPIDGGLIDGPVRATIFAQHQRYIRLTKQDPYAPFQSDLAVYHDDWGDYTNNEPTMDGTAGLTMYLASLEADVPANTASGPTAHRTFDQGAIVRMDSSKKEIYLVFTGHEFADGGESIAAALRKHSINASFFFTGDFYRTAAFAPLIGRLKQEGHYLGAHSDKHLLYASWQKRDSLLIDRDQFRRDITGNYSSMSAFGIAPSDAPYFLPSFEWYNRTIADWSAEFGLTLINFTGGTSSNADYTTPEMKNYLPSDSIVARIMRTERQRPGGLNGFLLLSHIGTDPRRTDKFYHRLDDVISALKRRGYTFKRL